MLSLLIDSEVQNESKKEFLPNSLISLVKLSSKANEDLPEVLLIFCFSSNCILHVLFLYRKYSSSYHYPHVYFNDFQSLKVIHYCSKRAIFYVIYMHTYLSLFFYMELCNFIYFTYYS